MKSNERLLIGGPHDGEIIQVAHNCNETRFLDGYDESSGARKPVISHYRPVLVKGYKQTFTVYVLDGMTPDEMFESLFSNYKPEKKETIQCQPEDQSN